MENKFAMTPILLVLLSTNLFLLLYHSPMPPIAWKVDAFDPLNFVLSRISSILMVYIATTACSKQHPSFESLLSRIHRTWRWPIITLCHVELYYTASASLLMVLKELATSTSSTTTEVVVIVGLVGSLLWAGPMLWAHSEITCKMSLVMSIVEDEGWEGGMEATKKAGAVVEGRRFQGFVLTVVMGMIERAGVGAVGVLLRFFVWFVYTGFYLECKKGGYGGHGKGRTCAEHLNTMM